MYLTPKISEIRKRRVALALSQRGLSLKAGLGGQAVNRIERGETSAIHPLRAAALADALGCTVDDICEASADKKVG